MLHSKRDARNERSSTYDAPSEPKDGQKISGSQREVGESVFAF